MPVLVARWKKFMNFSGTLLLLLVACNTPAKKNDRRPEEKFFNEQAGNISFIIPQGSLAYDHREELISTCRDAIKTDLDILKIPGFTDPITIQFVSSRAEMKKYTGMPAGGVANIQPLKIVYLLDNIQEGGPPIKHELMHIITLSVWGYPDRTSDWIKEGIAAFAEDQCNGYNVEQIYRFFSANNMLLPTDSLAAQFYREPEMIAYHQSAYIVQYLLANYGTEKLKELWTQGIANFEHIYGVPFARVKLSIDSESKHDHPDPPPIVWKTFSEGCQ
jgi:hypothetical protein